MASEVKALAGRAHAAAEIGSRAGQVQSASDAAVAAVHVLSAAQHRSQRSGGLLHRPPWRMGLCRTATASAASPGQREAGRPTALRQPFVSSSAAASVSAPAPESSAPAAATCSRCGPNSRVISHGMVNPWTTMVKITTV